MSEQKTYTDEDGVVRSYMELPFIRTRYNYDVDAASYATGLQCTDETMSQQQFKEECDINTIVKQFGITGQLPVSLQVPLVQEFTDIVDYHTAMNQIIEADMAFMKMPAEVREQFQNNAGRFVDFVSDPANIEQCDKWGLARPGWTAPVVEQPKAGGDQST